MRLCGRVVEDEPGFSRNLIEVECIVHKQKHIDGVRFGFPGHKRPEDYESLHVTRGHGQIVHTAQTHSHQPALNCGLAELIQDFLQLGAIHALRQISRLSDDRQAHGSTRFGAMTITIVSLSLGNRALLAPAV